MLRTFLYMALGIPALAMAQTADTARESGDTAVPPREVRVEGREVVGSAHPPADGTRRIGREELSRSASLTQLLAREPGVVMRQTGGLGSYATLSMRGSPSEQVEVWMDGVPLGGSAGSSVDLGPIGLDGLEHVDVRQAGALEGQGAPRIDLVSRKGWARQGGSARLGSFGEGAVSGWWGDGSGAVAVSAWLERANNDYPYLWDNGTTYRTSDDHVVRMRNNDFYATGAAIAVRPTETVDLGMRWDGSDRGISAPNLVDPQARYAQSSLQGNLLWKSPLWWHPFTEFSARRFASDWNDPNRSAGYNVDRHSEEIGLDGRAVIGAARTEGDWLDVFLSGALRAESSDRTSLGRIDVPVTPHGDRRSASLDLGWKGMSPQAYWGAEVSGRVERSVDARDWDAVLSTVSTGPRVETEFDGSRLVGRLWVHPSKALSLWTSASRRTRPPDFGEWMGDNGFSLSVPSLEPEVSNGLEIGSEWADHAWKVSVAVWRTDYQDPIEAFQLGASPIVSHRNGSGYRAMGIDSRLSWCGPWLGLSSGGTVQTGTLRSSNANIDGNSPVRFPQFKGNLEASIGPWQGATLGGNLDAQSQIFASELNWAGDLRPGRVMAGTWLRWRYQALSVLLAARNLLDLQPQDFEDLPLSGRSYSVRFDLDFPHQPKTSESTKP